VTVGELAQKTCTPCKGGVAPLTAAQAKALLAQAPGWALVEDNRKIEREFRFRDFAQALALVDDIGALAEAEGHHPDIKFGWGYATVTLYTHKINGLHENDFIVAAKINRLPGAAAKK
jgi:4a-hydroxytetrahydrobiopterin dehydratase